MLILGKKDAKVLRQEQLCWREGKSARRLKLAERPTVLEFKLWDDSGMSVVGFQ